MYGPHIAVLYARAASIQNSLSSLAHHFLSVDAKSYKLQPGGPGYELVYGCSAIPPYLKSLSNSQTLEATFDCIMEHEQVLIIRLLKYLGSDWCVRRGVRIVGDHLPSTMRVPTISFVIIGEHPVRSQDVVKAFDQRGDVGPHFAFGRFAFLLMICHRSEYGMVTSMLSPSSSTWSPRSM